MALMLENLKSIHNICQKYLENDLEKNFSDSLLKNPSFEDWSSNDFSKVLRRRIFEKKVQKVKQVLEKKVKQPLTNLNLFGFIF